MGSLSFYFLLSGFGYSIIQVTDDMKYSMTKAISSSSLTKSIFDTKTVMSAVVKNITPLAENHGPRLHMVKSHSTLLSP